MNVIYYKPWCPYSKRALNLLDERGIIVNKVDVDNDPSWKDRFKATYNISVSTVPQIFLGGKYIGGCSDLEKYLNNNKTSGGSNIDDSCIVM